MISYAEPRLQTCISGKYNFAEVIFVVMYITFKNRGDLHSSNTRQVLFIEAVYSNQKMTYI